MITATDLELRAGARILLSGATLRVQPGDRIGLVGRNGAGKTTTLRVLAGESAAVRRAPSTGAARSATCRRTRAPATSTCSPATGCCPPAASTRCCTTWRRRRSSWPRPPTTRPGTRSCAGTAGSRSGSPRSAGTRPSPRRPGSAPTSACPTGCSTQPLRHAVRRPAPPGRAGPHPVRRLGRRATTLLLDEPTNHLDADSITWLRDFLRAHTGGVVVISHDVDLLDAVVNKVWYLDANRAEADVYNVGWKTYLEAARDRRAPAPAGSGPTPRRRPARCCAQADKMRRQGDQGDRGPADGPSGRAAARRHSRTTRARDKVARMRFPTPAPCGRTPLTADGLSKSYGSLEVFTDVDLAVDRGTRVVVLGLNGAGKTTLLRLLAGVEKPDTGEVVPGHGLRLGYYAQEHETLDADRTVLENMRSRRRRTPADSELRRVLGAFLFSGETSTSRPACCPAARRPGSRWPCWSPPAPTCCCWTSRPTTSTRQSRSRCSTRCARYAGAVVLVTHDEGAVDALKPEKVILLPDGVEDTLECRAGRSGRARVAPARGTRLDASLRANCDGIARPSNQDRSHGHAMVNSILQRFSRRCYQVVARSRLRTQRGAGSHGQRSAEAYGCGHTQEGCADHRAASQQARRPTSRSSTTRARASGSWPSRTAARTDSCTDTVRVGHDPARPRRRDAAKEGSDPERDRTRGRPGTSPGSGSSGRRRSRPCDHSDRPDRLNAQTPHTWAALREAGRTLPADGPGRGGPRRGPRRSRPAWTGPCSRPAGSRVRPGSWRWPRCRRPTRRRDDPRRSRQAFGWLSPARASSASPPCRATRSGPASSSRWPATSASSPTTPASRWPSRSSAWCPTSAAPSDSVDLVGYSRALEICLTARPVGATRRCAIGLATVVVPRASWTLRSADLVAALLAVDREARPPRPRRCCSARPAATQDEQERAEREAQYRRLRALVADSGVARGSAADWRLALKRAERARTVGRALGLGGGAAMTMSMAARARGW